MWEVVRCSNCDASVSEWAACCPECGAGLADAVPVALPTEEPSAPTGTAHQAEDHRRPPRAMRRAVLVGTAVVAVTATLAALVVNRPQRHPTEPSAAPHATLPITVSPMQRYTVLYTDQLGPRVVPLDGGPTSTLMAAGPADPQRPVEVSGGVAFLRRGVVYFLATALRAAARPLGPADHLFTMLWPGLVGVQRGSGPGTVTVQFVSTTAQSADNSPVWQLPTGYQALAQAGSGLLVQDANGQLRIWSLDGGRLGPVISRSGDVIGTSGDEVAWRSNTGCDGDAECPLHITNASTGTDRVVSPPTAHGGFLGGGALSPDGRFLAAFIAAPFVSNPTAELVVVDLGASVIKRLANSAVDVGEPVGAAVWTADGTTVFFCGLNGQMRAYQPGDTGAVTVNVPASYNFAVW